MRTYSVTVKGTYQNLYKVKAKSEEEALTIAEDRATKDVMNCVGIPFDLTFNNFEVYIV